MTSELIDDLREHLPMFETIIDDVPYETHGITNVEAFLWFAMVGKLRPQVIIESGVCLGRSTHILALACSHFDCERLVAIDRDASTFDHVRRKIHGIAPVQFRCDLSHMALAPTRELARSLRGKSVLAVIDGPKKGAQLRSLYAALAKQKLVGICHHDMGETAASGRAAFKHAKKLHWPTASLCFTDSIPLDLASLNDPLLDALRVRHHAKLVEYEQRFGRRLTLNEYIATHTTVGLLVT